MPMSAEVINQVNTLTKCWIQQKNVIFLDRHYTLIEENIIIIGVRKNDLIHEKY